MLFNSIEFLLFLPVVLTLHFLLPHRFRWALLLAASYVFYMAWQPAYALLILASTLVDYTVALRMPHASARLRKLLLGCSLTVNLGLLASFKYYDMIVTTFAALVAPWWHWEPSSLGVLLPVGISFYTFQTLSYTIDVYRGTLPPERHLGRFALFVSFFPQLVAGPIERAGHILPQILTRQHWDTARAISGLRLVLWGMFKKVVIADQLAGFVNAICSDPTNYNGPAIVLGTLAFAYQILCDFSGYSDIAIGTARILGFNLSVNFDQPTLARNVAAFWSRWHITLVTWMRDYVFIPMGGSRVALPLVVFNVLFVFGVSGLWHGAAWHYVLWGLLNGVYIVVGRATRDAREAMAVATGFARWTRTRAFWQWTSTLAITYFSFPLFRAPDTWHCVQMWARIPFGWFELGLPWFRDLAVAVRIEPLILAFSLLMIPLCDVIEWMHRHPEKFASWPAWTRWAGDYALFFGILVFGHFTAQEFIYFQFWFDPLDRPDVTAT